MDTPKADNTATSAAATTTATVQPAASPVNAGPSAEQIKEARNNGFKVRGSGAHTRFCKYEAQIGSRIETETCMNPEQLGEYLVRAQQQRDQVSRVQSGTCSGPDCAVH
jgi:hypothetical protein